VGEGRGGRQEEAPQAATGGGLGIATSTARGQCPPAPNRTIDADERPDPDQRETLPLATAAEYILDECRMVLPGIQALFGFQLIAVFSAGFAEKLSRSEQMLHLGAIALTALAVALIMTPAALHRSMGSRTVSDLFVRVSSRLLFASMFPLALSISVEFYLIARVIVGGSVVVLFAIALLSIFVAFWFIFPEARGLHRRIGGSSHDP
jgi:hypothetical protein